MRELNIENRGLDFIEAKITAEEMMMITRFHSMLPADAKSFRQFIVAAHDQAGISRCAKILGWIKAEKPALAHGSGLLNLRIELVFGADCLRGIFDYIQLILLGNAMQRIHVTAQTEKMDRHNRANGRTTFPNDDLVRFFLALIAKKTFE